jgi:hypothetical protein
MLVDDLGVTTNRGVRDYPFILHKELGTAWMRLSELPIYVAI